MNMSSASNENKELYNSMMLKDYIDGAPHLKHKKLKKLYIELANKVVSNSKKVNNSVLDIGAGEGTTTNCFLSLGSKVTAVDISQNQLNSLKKKCVQYGDKLQVICEDVNDTVKRSEKYDIITINSFLHHIPDYCNLLQQASNLLEQNGQIFTWQDPLRYDTLNKFTSLFSKLAYFSWRIRKGDIIAGIKRRIRRSKGVYIDNVYDNAEYHVTRNGVDQDAIQKLFKDNGFNVEIIEYFSTQGSLWQRIGDLFKLKNTFGIIAQKK